MTTLVVTRTLPEPVARRAHQEYSTRFLGLASNFDRALFIEALADAEAALVTPADQLDAATISALPKPLRVLGTFSVGTDHIDLEAARRRGLSVVNTPDVLSFATAELAITLMLMAARRAGEGERIARAGAWKGWTPDFLLGTTLEGKVLGILGMGRIGQALGRMAKGFRMEITYHNRARLGPDHEQGARYVQSIPRFLGGLDVLSIHLPGGKETHHWLNRARIVDLKPGAIVINTGRGTTIDDDALADALRTKRIRAAGLDVFVHEPDIPEVYRTLENVVLLPHLGSATVETRVAMGMLALDGIAAVLAHQHPPNQVV